MAQQTPPVLVETVHQSMPIQLFAAFENQMSNVTPIVTFPLHDEGLGPDHFFRPTKLHGEAEHLTGYRMFKPEVINFTQTVARTENNVDKVILVIDLREPMGKSEFCA